MAFEEEEERERDRGSVATSLPFSLCPNPFNWPPFRGFVNEKKKV